MGPATAAASKRALTATCPCRGSSCAALIPTSYLTRKCHVPAACAMRWSCKRRRSVASVHRCAGVECIRHLCLGGFLQVCFLLLAVASTSRMNACPLLIHPCRFWSQRASGRPRSTWQRHLRARYHLILRLCGAGCDKCSHRLVCITSETCTLLVVLLCSTEGLHRW